ncbi:MAG: type II secretion system major pseudopilin GspG [Planctomycetes bacterium]|nr:type II secretion system major pseudopilin GspG [Planctomycetota bacterium]
MKRRRRGFTLVEILVVIVIITMLATLIVPNIGKQFNKAKIGIAKTNIALIETALQEFLMECSRYPTNADGGLEALVVAPSDLVEVWDGPYMDPDKLVDPWGFDFMYQFPSQDGIKDYDVYSFGPDGQPGGTGANEDIYN